MPILPFRLRPRLPTKSRFLHTGLLPYTPPIPTSTSPTPSPCCPICAIAFTETPHTLRLRRCGHAVCTLCLILWLDYFDSCPVCRKRVYRGEISGSSFVEEIRGLFAGNYGVEEDGDGDGEGEEEGLGDASEFWREDVVVGEYTESWDGEVDCVICLESLLLAGRETVVIRSCMHAFHHACLSRWLEKQNTCPICRALLFRKEKMKTMWEELDENAYFVPQLGDVRGLAWRGGVLERLVSERVRVIGEPEEVRGLVEDTVIGGTDSAE